MNDYLPKGLKEKQKQKIGERKEKQSTKDIAELLVNGKFKKMTEISNEFK